VLYFLASRIFWFLFSPANFLIFVAVAAVVALFTRFARFGRNLLVAVTAAYVLCGFGPIGNILMRPLEDRFPPPPATMPAPAGIIVLGGALKAELSNARGVTTLAEEGGRMTETAILALRFPSARIVFSGGSADMGPGERDEAHAAQQLLVSLGIPAERMILENHSLNTEENALLTRKLVRPLAGQQWLLVTSAVHTPRAMGVFRHAGFNVVAYPTDYLTEGSPADFWKIRTSPNTGIAILDAAVHEWAGLIAYRLMGRTDAFFPAPNPELPR
jgi:uncharacterized SAM-binding protein YcdF (DUF218 family)